MADEQATPAAPAPEQPAAQQPVTPPEPTAGGAQQPAQTISMTQADLDKLVGDRLQREREKAAKEAAKAQAQAQAEQLKGQAQWETLAKQHEQELEKLRPAAELAERQGKVIEQLYTTRLTSLPAALRKAVESLPATDLLERLAWLDQNEAILRTAQVTPDVNAGGNGAPGAIGYGGLSQEELAAVYGVKSQYLK